LSWLDSCSVADLIALTGRVEHLDTYVPAHPDEPGCTLTGVPCRSRPARDLLRKIGEERSGRRVRFGSLRSDVSSEGSDV